MFPPQATDTADKWLEQMLSSLERAGLELSKDIVLDKIEDGKLSVLIRANHVADAAWKPLKQYMQQYSQACGWRIEKVCQVRGGMIFLASRD